MDTETHPTPALYRTSRRDGLVSAPFWDFKIQSLLQRGQCFLQLRFADDGYIFRGLRNGLGEALHRERAGHFETRHSLAKLEKSLGVYFVSNALDDALAVASLNREEADAGVFAFPARVFNAALNRGQAAVLAFAEGGLVFRYPFFSQPPRLVDAEHLLVNEAGMKRVIALEQRTPSGNRNGEGVGTSTTLVVLPRPAQMGSPTNGMQGFPPGVCGAAYVKSELRPSAASA